MIPRLLILIGLVLAGFSALFYLVTRVHRFRFSLALARGRHGWSWVISVLAVLLPSAAIWLAWGYMNAIICLLHLALFWLLSDALFALLKRLHGKPWRRYYAGLTALLLTAAYLSAGWVQAHHVWQTNYIIHTDKPVDTLRVALIADSHMGTTFHADGFARELDRIAAQKPDLLVIAGDFVDEDTEKDDMGSPPAGRSGSWICRFTTSSAIMTRAYMTASAPAASRRRPRRCADGKRRACAGGRDRADRRCLLAHRPAGRLRGAGLRRRPRIHG